MAEKKRRRGKRALHEVGQMDMVADINMDMEFGERVGHGGW